MNKTSSIKKISVLLVVCLLLIATVGTLAYFTDREESNATVSTAANGVDITTDPEDLSSEWAEVNADVFANFNPGDCADLGYTLKNTGDSAIDVRETMVITCEKDLSAASPEFRVFTGTTTDAAGAYDGSDVVAGETVSGNKVTYKPATFTLSSATDVVGTAPTEKAMNYWLVFNKLSSNTYQGVAIQIDYIVEVKQHTNDGSGWDIIKTETITLNGNPYNVAPAIP